MFGAGSRNTKRELVVPCRAHGLWFHFRISREDTLNIRRSWSQSIYRSSLRTGFPTIATPLRVRVQPNDTICPNGTKWRFSCRWTHFGVYVLMCKCISLLSECSLTNVLDHLLGNFAQTDSREKIILGIIYLSTPKEGQPAPDKFILSLTEDGRSLRMPSHLPQTARHLGGCWKRTGGGGCSLPVANGRDLSPGRRSKAGSRDCNGLV